MNSKTDGGFGESEIGIRQLIQSPQNHPRVFNDANWLCVCLCLFRCDRMPRGQNERISTTLREVKMTRTERNHRDAARTRDGHGLLGCVKRRFCSLAESSVFLSTMLSVVDHIEAAVCFNGIAGRNRF
jgi:hypothetical protein